MPRDLIMLGVGDRLTARPATPEESELLRTGDAPVLVVARTSGEIHVYPGTGVAVGCDCPPQPRSNGHRPTTLADLAPPA